MSLALFTTGRRSHALSLTSLGHSRDAVQQPPSTRKTGRCRAGADGGRVAEPLLSRVRTREGVLLYG